MVSALVDVLAGAGAGILVALLGLLPAVSLADFPVSLPSGVTDVLSVLNYFVPIGDLITIVTVWLGLVLALNVFYIVYGLYQKLAK